MTAMVSMNSNSCCCSCAAACTFAPILPILDTAMTLVVSICVLCLGILRIRQP